MSNDRLIPNFCDGCEDRHLRLKALDAENKDLRAEIERLQVEKEQLQIDLDIEEGSVAKVVKETPDGVLYQLKSYEDEIRSLRVEIAESKAVNDAWKNLINAHIETCGPCAELLKNAIKAARKVAENTREADESDSDPCINCEEDICLSACKAKRISLGWERPDTPAENQ